MLTLDEIFFALQIGVLAYVITFVLMQEGYILEFYLDFLLMVENERPVYKWLAKPLGLCEKCFCGQIALWVWLAVNSKEYYMNAVEATFRHCLFIAFAIIFVSLIERAMR